jgi:hypothetical protein
MSRIKEAGTMSAIRSLVEELIVGAVRAELGRALGKAAEPVDTKIDDVIAETAQRIAKPVHAKVQALAEDAAHQAVTSLFERLWPDDRKPKGVQNPAAAPPKRPR